LRNVEKMFKLILNHLKSNVLLKLLFLCSNLTTVIFSVWLAPFGCSNYIIFFCHLVVRLFLLFLGEANRQFPQQMLLAGHIKVLGGPYVSRGPDVSQAWSNATTILGPKFGHCCQFCLYSRSRLMKSLWAIQNW